MVRQELVLSCGAACARQLLLDAGKNVSEAIVREHAGFDHRFPLDAQELGKVLTRLHPDPGATYKGGGVLPQDLQAIAARGPFMALLKVKKSKHWVIVDRVDYLAFDGIVYLRDPAGSPEDDHVGAEVAMPLDDFLEGWRQAINGVVFRET
jgi:hypothetical protein